MVQRCKNPTKNSGVIAKIKWYALFTDHGVAWKRRRTVQHPFLRVSQRKSHLTSVVNWGCPVPLVFIPLPRSGRESLGITSMCISQAQHPSYHPTNKGKMGHPPFSNSKDQSRLST